MFTTDQITLIRREVCSALEELGGVNTRLRDMESGTSMPSDQDDVENWLFESARILEELAQNVQKWRTP